MSRIALILGTDHRFQWKSPDFSDSQHQQFIAFVVTTARAYKVVAFAEENNSEALDEKGKKESVIQIMACELAIPRRHCDPTVRNEQCCDFSGERYSRNGFFRRNHRINYPTTNREIDAGRWALLVRATSGIQYVASAFYMWCCSLFAVFWFITSK